MVYFLMLISLFLFALVLVAAAAIGVRSIWAVALAAFIASGLGVAAVSRYSLPHAGSAELARAALIIPAVLTAIFLIAGLVDRWSRRRAARAGT